MPRLEVACATRGQESALLPACTRGAQEGKPRTVHSSLGSVLVEPAQDDLPIGAALLARRERRLVALFRVGSVVGHLARVQQVRERGRVRVIGEQRREREGRGEASRPWASVCAPCVSRPIFGNGRRATVEEADLLKFDELQAAERCSLERSLATASRKARVAQGSAAAHSRLAHEAREKNARRRRTRRPRTRPADPGRCPAGRCARSATGNESTISFAAGTASRSAREGEELERLARASTASARSGRRQQQG